MDRPSKKRRHTSSPSQVTNPDENQAAEAAEDNEEDISNLLLDGDDFVSDESAEEEARRRREAGRRRLKDRPADNAAQADQTMAWTRTEDTTHSSRSDALRKTQSSVNNAVAEVGNDEDNQEDDDDDFDMFSSSVSPVVDDKKKSSLDGASLKRGHEQEDWDDAEGYYKAYIGELISVNSTGDSEERSAGGTGIGFRVSGVIGKGVFSTVLKCTTINNSSSVELPPVVALKCIRHNETMAKAALQELRMLHRLKGAPGIVPLLLPATLNPIEYRGHVVLIFSYMEYNLRDVLQKFGKGVGLSLQAVRSYFGQMLAAATHLKKHGVLHADIKLDNILVRADFGTVQLADFGSAMEVGSPEVQPTPYLVSRFYRAPEIILGLLPTHAIDLWSVAVSVAELFLGNVLFTGKSNNDMLYCFMQHMGAFSNRIIRQHLAQCQRLGLPQHFQLEGAVYSFKQQTIDPISGSTVYQMRSLSMNDKTTSSGKNKFPFATPLNHKIVKAKSASDLRSMVLQFSDLLQKCLVLDPTRRIDLRDALRHEFFAVEASTSKGSSEGGSTATAATK